MFVSVFFFLYLLYVPYVFFVFVWSTGIRIDEFDGPPNTECVMPSMKKTNMAYCTYPLYESKQLLMGNDTLNIHFVGYIILPETCNIHDSQTSNPSGTKSHDFH